MKVTIAFKDNKITYIRPIRLPAGELSTNVFSHLTLMDDESKSIDIFTLKGFYQTDLEEKKMAITHFFESHDFNFNRLVYHLPFFNSAQSPTAFCGEILFDIESALFPFIKYELPNSLVIQSNSLGIEHLENALCLKIKISPDKSSLKELATLVNKSSQGKTLPLLRLDGNRKFELHELVLFMNELNERVLERIDYIEEPFKNFYDLYSFQKIYPQKIAIDESLTFYQEHLDCLPFASPLILKPALFGISKSFQLIRNASELGHKVIVSSTYQPGSTFFPLLALASYSDSFHKSPLFHGLDTLSFLPLLYQNSLVLNSLSIN